MHSFLLVSVLGSILACAWRGGDAVAEAPTLLPFPSTPETDFWAMLNAQEQLWMMNSSVILHLHHWKSTGESGASLAPILRLNMPASLAPKVLNGNIPAQFQEKLVLWIKNAIGTDDDGLAQLAQGSEVCGTKICSGYPGMGESCCPFG